MLWENLLPFFTTTWGTFVLALGLLLCTKGAVAWGTTFPGVLMAGLGNVFVCCMLYVLVTRPSANVLVFVPAIVGSAVLFHRYFDEVMAGTTSDHARQADRPPPYRKNGQRKQP